MYQYNEFDWKEIDPGVCLPHDIPAWCLWLSVLEYVEATNGYTVSADKMGDLDIDMPVEPGPELVSVSDRCFGKLQMRSVWGSSVICVLDTHLANAVEPRLSTIKADLNTLNLVSSTVVRISFNAVRISFLDLTEWNLFAMCRFDNSRVEVLLIARSVWVPK